MAREAREEESGVTRRSFLKAAGAAFVAGSQAIAQEKPKEGGGEKPEEGKPVPILGPGAVALEVTVNGAVRKLSVEPRVTLLEALRHELDLTGAKEVCDRGACGGCTVLLDGVPVCACMTLALDARGKAVTTVEGLAKGDELHPVQAAFVRRDALQCGFCTPGMVVAAAGLLHENPEPTLEQIRRGLAGNICRCGTYTRVFEAVQDAAKELKGDGHGGQGKDRRWF